MGPIPRLWVRSVANINLYIYIYIYKSLACKIHINDHPCMQYWDAVWGKKKKIEKKSKKRLYHWYSWIQKGSWTPHVHRSKSRDLLDYFFGFPTSKKVKWKELRIILSQKKICKLSKIVITKMSRFPSYNTNHYQKTFCYQEIQH